MLTSFSSRLLFYVGLNLCFALLVGVLAMNGAANPRILYLLVLFSLCSLPVIFYDGLNGRYSLLCLFCGLYFLMFGSIDIAQMIDGAAANYISAPLTRTELVALAGVFAVLVTYISICRWLASRPSAALVQAKDWRMSSGVSIGLVFWIVGTVTLYYWNVYVVPDTTNDVVRKSLQSRGNTAITLLLLGQMVQPLGLLLLIYVWRVAKYRWLTAFVIFAVIVQVFVGFVADVKALAMYGGFLVIATTVLIRGRVPIGWLAAALAFIVLAFPVLQTYRAEIHQSRGVARTAVVENFGKVLALTIASTERANTGTFRAQTFLERYSMLGSLQIIVDHVDIDVPRQNGYTLSPLLTTFVPKMVWAEKQDIPTGQIMNRVFHISDSEDVYISPSYLGELYWNFGWAGVLIGMSFMGALLGFIGHRFNLRTVCTVTRVLVVAITIKQLIVNFEGGIAPNYVVWMRVMAAIGILHLIFARVPVASHQEESAAPDMPDDKIPARPFPNLVT